MASIFRALLVTAIAIPAASLAADSVQLTPGRWQEIDRTTAMAIAGRQVPANLLPKDVESALYCIPPNEAREPASFFRGNVRGDQCALKQKWVANGQVALSYGCESPDGLPGTWMIKGTYSNRTYQLTWQINTSYEKQPVTITKTMEGRFVGRCTGREKGHE